MLESRKKVLAERLRERAGGLEKTAKLGPVGKAEAWAYGSPFTHLAEGAKQFFVGGKATHGAMKGTRLRPSGKMKPISKEEYLTLKAQQGQQGVPGVRVNTLPSGKTVFEKEHYHYGGLTGIAQKHPLMTGLVGGGGYLLYKTKPPKQPKPPNPYLQHPQARGWGKAPGPQGPVPMSSGKWG